MLFTGGWFLLEHLPQVGHDLQLPPPPVLFPREVSPTLGRGRGRGLRVLGGGRSEEGGRGEGLGEAEFVCRGRPTGGGTKRGKDEEG